MASTTTFQGEQLLVGRRFLDQLRGPQKRPGAGLASVLSGPRKAEEDDEEAWRFENLVTANWANLEHKLEPEPLEAWVKDT